MTRVRNTNKWICGLSISSQNFYAGLDSMIGADINFSGQRTTIAFISANNEVAANQLTLDLVRALPYLRNLSFSH